MIDFLFFSHSAILLRTFKTRIRISQYIQLLFSQILMKTPISFSNVRKPIPSMDKQQKAREKKFFIDQQFENIINKQCPGKLYKLIKQKTKRSRTEPTIETNLNNENNLKVFERTFYKQRIKTLEKDQRMHEMRQQLRKILKINQKPENSFFQISRRTLIGLQRRSVEFMTERTNKKIKAQSSFRHRTKKNSFVHPYLKISESTSQEVLQQIFDKTRHRNQKIIEFKPFGDIEFFDVGN